MVIGLIGGASSSSICTRTSSDKYLQAPTSVPPVANFMAKAKQVGNPQSLHPCFFGISFTRSVPLTAIAILPYVF
jgi:hypothetical protein